MDFKKKAGLALALAAIFTTAGSGAALAGNVTDASDVTPGDNLVVGGANLTPDADFAIEDGGSIFFAPGTTEGVITNTGITTTLSGTDVAKSTPENAINLKISGGDVVLEGLNFSKILTLDGTIAAQVNDNNAIDTLVGGSDATINVGNSDADPDLDTKGTLVVGKADLAGAAVFVDPSFKTGVYDPSQANFGGFTNKTLLNTAADTAIDGSLTAGQNGTIVVGSTSSTWLNNAIASTNNWTVTGQTGHGLTAGFGVIGGQTLLTAGTFGEIEVDGGLEDATNTQIAGAANFWAADRSITAIDLTSIGTGLDDVDNLWASVFSGVDAAGDPAALGTVSIGLFYDGSNATTLGDDSATLYLDNAQAGKDYVIFEAAASITIGGVTLADGNVVNDTLLTDDAAYWYDEGMIFSSGLLTGDLTAVANGSEFDLVLTNVERNKVAVQTVFGSMSGGMADLVDELYTDGTNANAFDADDFEAAGVSNNRGIQFVSRATSGTYMPNRTEAAATLEGAAQIAVAAGVPFITNNVVTRISDLIVDHNNLLNDTQPAYGNEPGSFGIWANPFYATGDTDGMDAGRFQNGFDYNYGGAAFGIDYNINEAFRLGLALNVGGGDSDSEDNGDFNTTNADFDFFGVSLYGSYTNGAFGLTGDMGFTGVDSEIDQNVPGSMQMSNLESNVDSDAFTVGLTGQYRFAASDNFNITPHLGLRYTKISVDDANVDLVSGGRVFDVTTEDQNLFQIPVGVEFSSNIVTDGGWTVTPSADLGVLFTAGDTDVESRARIAGTNFSTGAMSADVNDSAAFQGRLGIKAAADNGLSLGLDYGILASGNQTDHQFSGMLRFEF